MVGTIGWLALGWDVTKDI